MRTKIAAAMTALALLLFPLGAFMIVHQGFSLTMERERARALSEEAAIARAVALEIALVYRGQVMAGSEQPQAQNIKQLLETHGRATLLDGAAHR